MTSVEAIIEETSIEGLDIPEALARLNNMHKMYVRIISSFVQNMPKMLSALAKVTKETLPDYSIRVHGAKSSLYGIGAVTCGDMAFELEKFSKNDDWAAVEQKNASFIESVYKLLGELEKLLARIESSRNAAINTPTTSPDKAKLAELLAATKRYDIDTMMKLLEELESKAYTSNQNLVPQLRRHLDNFEYDGIIEKLMAAL